MFAYCGNAPVIFADPAGTSYKERLTNELREYETQLLLQYIRAMDPQKLAKIYKLVEEKNAAAENTGTFSCGVSLSGACCSGGAASFGFAIDARGTIGAYFTSNELIGTPSAGISLNLAVSEAPDIYKLSGEGIVIGGSANVLGASVGIEYSESIDRALDIKYRGWSLAAGASVGPPAEGHIGSTQTAVAGFNYYDFRIGLMKWWYF